MNRIYSSIDLALDNAEKYMLLQEEDVYLCQCRYPSGIEYSYRKEKDIAFRESQSIVKIYTLPVWHLFRKKGNALRAKKRFEQEHNCKLTCKRTRLSNNDYVYTLSYVQ